MNTPQKPIDSGFSTKATASEVLVDRNLKGKTVIVTGGYSGIGLETTRVLAEAGAVVIVPARSIEKAKAALSSIPNVEIDVIDLMDAKSIDAFAQRFIDSGRPLHILINDAGIMAAPLRHDSRGYESQFSTNHLGHFQLTARLWPALKKAKGARVIALSSWGHHVCGIDFDDPNFLHRDYNKWAAYGQAKSANVLFAVELDKRGAAYGVRAFAVHPGGIPGTDLGRDLGDDERIKMPEKDEKKQVVDTEMDNFIKTVEQGAATTVWCATSPVLEAMGGVYCENINIAQAVAADCTQQSGVWPWAIDRNMAVKLWQLSEKLTGVKFDI